ncbi:unnamed protein product [Brassica rapa subsp. trilocularis]
MEICAGESFTDIVGRNSRSDKYSLIAIKVIADIKIIRGRDNRTGRDVQDDRYRQ